MANQPQPTKQATKPHSPATTSQPAPAPTKSTAAPIIDISKLTAEQLAALQKQLRGMRSETKETKDERFKIIDQLLQEKDSDGTFKHTTREIAHTLKDNNLVNEKDPEWYPREIKRIQARKQFLEKQTDKAGQLVHPAGTFGYKAAEGGFGLTPEGVVGWFNKPENVEKLSAEQSAAVMAALS